MPVTNMSWKAALDMGALFMCSTTSKMIYDKEWLEFCQVIYHIFGGGIMNTLRGRAHFSHVTSSRSRKGFFKPVEGEFNFPIPSLPMLKKLDIGYPMQIDVGIIQHSIDVTEEQAKEGEEFILSFDGKLISPDITRIQGTVTCGEEKDLLISRNHFEFFNIHFLSQTK